MLTLFLLEYGFGCKLQDGHGSMSMVNIFLVQQEVHGQEDGSGFPKVISDVDGTLSGFTSGFGLLGGGIDIQSSIKVALLMPQSIHQEQEIPSSRQVLQLI